MVALAAAEVARIEKQWNEEAMEAIIAAAKRNKVDLIVMASHGRKGIKRLLLGSETQQVLTHSHIPVLVLR